MVVWGLLCHSCRFDYQERLYPLWGRNSLTMAFTGKTVYIAHHFMLPWFDCFDLWVNREGWWFKKSLQNNWGLLVKKKHMQFWQVTRHDNSTKIYLLKKCLVRGFFVLFTHQIFNYLWHLRNLKNTFLCELAQII